MTTLEGILEKEMRGERIPGAELSPEAVELLVAYRTEPKDVLELFRRAKTLKAYLKIPDCRRLKIREQIIEFQDLIKEGKNRGGGLDKLIHDLTYENAAYTVASYYVKFAEDLTADDIAGYARKHPRRLFEHYCFNNFISHVKIENGNIALTDRNETGFYQSLLYNAFGGKSEKLLSLVDKNLAKQVMDAERQIQHRLKYDHPRYLANEAAGAYARFIENLTIEDVVAYRTGQSVNVRKHYDLPLFLTFGTRDLKIKNKCQGYGDWGSFWSNDLITLNNFYSLLDANLKKRVLTAQKRAGDLVLIEYPRYIAKEAAIEYVSFVQQLKLQDIADQAETQGNYLMRHYDLPNFLTHGSWKNGELKINHHREGAGDADFIWRTSKFRLDLFLKLLEGQKLQNGIPIVDALDAARKSAEHLVDLHYQKKRKADANEAARKFIQFARNIKLEDIIAYAEEHPISLLAHFDVPNFLTNSVWEENGVRLKNWCSKGHGNAHTLWKEYLKHDLGEFIKLLDKGIEGLLKSSRERISNLVETEYPRAKAINAAEAYIQFVRRLSPSDVIRYVKDTATHPHLMKHFGLRHFLSFGTSEGMNDKAHGDFFTFFSDKLESKLDGLYRLLDKTEFKPGETYIDALQKAQLRSKKIIEHAWSREITECIQKAGNRLSHNRIHSNKIGLPTKLMKNEDWHLNILQYYMFKTGEKEHLLEEILKYQVNTLDKKEHDKRNGLAAADSYNARVEKIRHTVVAAENSVPWQLIAYLEHSNALKVVCGDTGKYERLLKQLHSELLRDGIAGLEAKGLSVDTQERWVKENSLNPNFRIDLILKPKNDEYGLDEQVHRIFLKLFNNPDRWKHECKVSRELSSLGIPVISPRAITLNEDYFKLIERASLDPDMQTLTLPSLIGNHYGKDYHFALASQFVDGQTLRDTIKNAWTQLEEEAEEPDMHKGLLERKYQALQEPLKKVNCILKQLHSIKPGQILENKLETRDYQNFFRNRIDQITKFTSAETISNANLTSDAHSEYRAALADLNRAYTNSGIGSELEKALQKYTSVVHGDLHSSNLLITNNELTLIDTEFAALGLPQEDLATQLAEPHFITQEKSAEKIAREYANRFIDNYMDTMQISEREDFLAATGLFGMTRSSMLLAAHAVKSRYAAQEAKQDLRKTCDRHLKAIDYFAEMATTNRPHLEPRVTAFANRVRQLSLPKAA